MSEARHKIISKKYWQDIKKLVEQISIKFEGFRLNKINLVENCAVDKSTNISAKYRWELVYRSIFKRSNIGR